MGANTKIEWTDATWNPIRGCTRVSEGCRNCYAEIMAARFSKPGQWGHGYAEMKGGDHRWTGKVGMALDRLDQPLRWRQPRRIFVNSTSDLFHEALPDYEIAKVFEVMRECPQHIFQILTKRPERMRRWVSMEDGQHVAAWLGWPLANVWLGTSVEDQGRADERIPPLLNTPAAVHFISAEPLLGPIRLRKDWLASGKSGDRRGLDWVIAGAESGPHAQPCDLAWVRSIRDQCAAASVAFFWKQHAERGRKIPTPALDGQQWTQFPDAA